ncbi:hypothetical protein SNE40_022818 [Patella caerulea]|uniref:C-type lectin domain-containing protein n=1 Tax=Patella caerulea TaxID=87958 RepID=A0AAN8GG02_PATCE
MYNKLIWDLVFVWFVFSRFLSVKSGGILVCKNGYEDMEGYCLKAHTEPATFPNAIEKCRQDGGQLVTIKNSDKQLVINNFRYQKQLPSNTRVWFGLKQNDTKWKWIDGTSLVYSNWRSSAITTGTGEGFRLGVVISLGLL